MLESVTGIQPPPLVDAEKAYKSFYIQNPHAGLDRPKTLREIRELVPELTEFEGTYTSMSPEDLLHEQAFPTGLDVLVIPALRYGPAFLHSHSFFEVICVLSGECENHFASHSLHMTAGDFCIIAPNSVHAISVFRDDCVVYNLTIRSTTFETAFLKSLPQDGALCHFFTHSLYTTGKDTYLYFKTGPDAQLMESVLQMRKEFQRREPYYGAMLNAMLATFFVRLLRNHEGEIVVPNSSLLKMDSSPVYILKYIEQHYKTLTLKDLAAFFGYSDRQMIRILRVYTGESFKNLLLDARMTHACELLRQPKISISSILSEIGYSNESHFYQLFQKKFGMTPSEYRRKFAADEFRLL